MYFRTTVFLLKLCPQYFGVAVKTLLSFNVKPWIIFVDVGNIERNEITLAKEGEVIPLSLILRK